MQYTSSYKTCIVIILCLFLLYPFKAWASILSPPLLRTTTPQLSPWASHDVFALPHGLKRTTTPYTTQEVYKPPQRPVISATATPAKVKVPEEYMAGLQEIVKLNGYSLYEKRHDGVYKKDLYGKLRRIVAVSPEELKEETYDAYTDIEIGLELLDKPTVEEGLREVLELLGKIE